MTMFSDNFWRERRCCLDPVGEIFEAAYLFDKAATAHLEGRRIDAERLIKEADNRGIYSSWTEKLWGPNDRLIHRLRPDSEKPAVVEKEKRTSGYIPVGIRRKIIKRDGYVCRFCNIPVIDPAARKVLQEAYPQALRWGDDNEEQHAAFQAMDIDFDHVRPLSLGGDHSLYNLIVACSPCNSAKSNNTLKELGLMDPRELLINKNPLDGPIRWDGLARLSRRCLYQVE